MRYFDHDTTASLDDKIMTLRLEYGGAAVDAYWVALEQIYRDETPLVIFENQLGTKALSYRLCVDVKTLETWFSTMIEIGLFERDVENSNAIVSQRAMRNIKDYRERCETARKNGKKGGRKPKQKPSRNRVGLQVGTDAETDSLANAKLRKEKKGIGLYKNKPIPIPNASVGADVDNSTLPDVKPYCPLCNIKLWQGTGDNKWHCDECASTFDTDKVVWQ